MSETPFNPFSLAGKTVLVTGASSGIGRQIALSCAQAGADIVASGRNEARLASLIDELPPDAHRPLACDLGDNSQTEALAEQASKLHGLVHCAGTALLAPLHMATNQHIEDQLAVNTVAPMHLTRQLLLRNALQPGDAIVFVSSISAHIGVAGVAAYSASKAALEAMARCLAMEVARKKIRANCLAPAWSNPPCSKRPARPRADWKTPWHATRWGPAIPKTWHARRFSSSRTQAAGSPARPSSSTAATRRPAEQMRATPRKLIIIGAGGLGRIVYDVLARDTALHGQCRLGGFLDTRAGLALPPGLEIPVLGNPLTWQPAPEDRYIPAVGNPHWRDRLVSPLAARGARFFSYTLTACTADVPG
jgi:NAD(P)-dependent dehydrogenase (short-subunit alcohol dehydrogenase family)